ncbi:MAG: NADH-quinone oxidoreductase subunit L [Deltaproteobacteria bacterium]|nr:NADH-quinone oxidoreductase subunit L [Deltaproteobacteria bacterium]
MVNIPTKLISLIPALPLVGFLINSMIALAWARRRKPVYPEQGRRVSEIVPSIIGCALPIASFVLSAWAFFDLREMEEGASLSSGSLFTWLSTPLFSVDFAFLVDPLSAVMILVVTGVGSIIHVYSVGYMHKDEGFARYFSYLNLFLFFMLLLVMGDNLLVLFVGWEGVGLCSYLLIGFWFTDPEKATCGKKAFVVNRIGDFGFLIGLFLILFAFQSQGQSGEGIFSYSFLTANKEWLAPLATTITLCLFIGATGKSAQIPLYVWLPDAMAGPTPVSALIHAATMVTAGIYMVARLGFLFALAPFTLHVIACIGLATALMAALIGLTQFDIKKVLAYSTVSQLGTMFLALGVGAYSAAIFHLVTHAFFKACLFLSSGSVIHACHDQDIRNMGGLFKKMPVTGVTFLVATLAIAGIPPLAGFFSKDEILWNTLLYGSWPFYGVALFTAGITAFYMFRLFVYTFLGKTRHPHPDHIHESPRVMTIPLIILAGLAAVGGFLGVPEVLGGGNRFHHWLSGILPVSAGHEGNPALELGLMGLSTVWALVISLLSVGLYSRRLDWPAVLTRRIRFLYELVYQKFKVDEIYDALIVRPIRVISEKLFWKGFDEKLIDGFLVHGWTDTAAFSARLVSRVQTGLVGHYLLYFWVALVVLLVWAV